MRLTRLTPRLTHRVIAPLLSIGINGLGRIGKALFRQLIDDVDVNIVAINAVNLKITDVEDYLNYDSVGHNDGSNILVSIDGDYLIINHHRIHFLSERDAEKISWECDYLVDATGAFLTAQLCQKHKTPYVIMSAPPLDDTPSFIYGANHHQYRGEKIVSASSCTSNCLAPLIKLISDNYNIENCSFLTIHAATGSQNVVDSANTKRSGRSVLNNIIPYSTGASRELVKIFPELKGKIFGNSVRIPVSNVSLVDITLRVTEKLDLADLQSLISASALIDKVDVFGINNKPLVSCDFIGTVTPSIFDATLSFKTTENEAKLSVWYDNEWSYAAQVVRLVKHMFQTNHSPTL